MKLKLACDGCGRGTTGATAGLSKVNGKYLCRDCKSNPDGVKRYFCTSCSASSASARQRGSGWIEVVLYICYIVPGIIYSIWRRSGNSKVCPACKRATLISAQGGTHVKCPDCRELVLADARKCRHCGLGLVPQV